MYVLCGNMMNDPQHCCLFASVLFRFNYHQFEFILQSYWYYQKFLHFNITSVQDGSEQTFHSHMKTDFYKIYKTGC